MPLQNQNNPSRGQTEMPYVMRDKPVMITTDNEVNNPENLAFTASPPPVLEPEPASAEPTLSAPTSDDLLEKRREDIERAAEEAAEEAAISQDAQERVSSRHADAEDRDDMLGTPAEDDLSDVVAGGDSDDDNDLSDVTDVDDEDVTGYEEGENDEEDNDFSDVLEVDREDVMGAPPARKQNQVRRVRSSVPANPQLGGLL